MKKVTTVLLLLTSTFALQACAEGRGGPREIPSFEEMDTNGDGELQLEELKGPLADDFDKLDADGSGGLSEEEVPPPPPRHK
ncbi:hypothetical protein ACQKQC_06790 [Vibrio fortis]|uniref:hypothetical protein n=1 Tax=Vibrio fortis TaxID=212667 RepID=UPI004068B437